MKPTKYELFERDGAIVLRGYAPEAQNGWFNVEVVKRISWRTIPEPPQAGRPPRCALGRPVRGQARRRQARRQVKGAAQGGINTRRLSASCWASFRSNV